MTDFPFMMMLAASVRDLFWSSALTWQCLLAMAGLGLILVALLAGYARLQRATASADKATPADRPTRRWLMPLRDQNGTATIEFALVFPIILFLGLTLAQVTLLMVGNYFVHYAAFAAARSAIVVVPVDYEIGGEPRNVIDSDPRSGKLRVIHEAAALALVPVAGQLDSADIDVSPFVEGLAGHFASYGQSEPNWVDRLAANRLRYAFMNTQVMLNEPLVFGDEVEFVPLIGVHEFGPRDPITVHVEHQLHLSVPFARVFFADGPVYVAGGAQSAYALVEARATLTNQGIDSSLPPAPELPREP